MTKVLVFASEKEGTGKTTPECNAPSFLASQMHKRSLANLDSQSHPTIHAGFDHLRIKYEIYEVLMSFSAVGKANSSALVRQESLFLLFWNDKSMLLDSELERIQKLRAVLKNFLMGFDGLFDYIFIDTLFSSSLSVVNMFVSFHCLLVPVRLNFLSCGFGVHYELLLQNKRDSLDSFEIARSGAYCFPPRSLRFKECIVGVTKNFCEHVIISALRNDIKMIEVGAMLDLFTPTPWTVKIMWS